MKKSMTRGISWVLVVLLLLGVFAPSAFAAENVLLQTLNITEDGLLQTEDILLQALHFTDVRPAQWHSHYIRLMREYEIMSGTGNNQFSPDAPFTRAQVVATLYRLAGSPEITFAPVFSDVPESAPGWYRDAVTWASEREIVLGFSGRFDPNAPVTREAFAAMVSRFATYQEYDLALGDGDIASLPVRFTDRGDVSGWAEDHMAWAFYRGLITGVTETRLAPQGRTTRAQAAAILVRFGVITDRWEMPERPAAFAATIETAMTAIPQIMENASIAGMTVAIVDAESGFTWTQGFGYADAANEVSVDEHTVFPLASISKTFTAIAVMQLVEAGLLDLDTPIVMYLPDFSILPSAVLGGDYRNITVRMLLSHTSGILTGFAGYGMFSAGAYNRAFLNNMLENLANYTMLSQENTAFTYANMGFDILGILVAELTGNNNFFDDFVAYTRANIFEVAGMTRSSFALTDAIAPYLARPHIDAQTVDTFLYFNALPTGGMMSSAYDMAQFMHVLLSGGGDLLSEASTAQMLTEHDFDFSASLGGMRYGLGVMHRTSASGFASVGHGGTLVHYHSDMAFDLESGIGVFVSLNSITGLPLPALIVSDLLELAVEEKTGSLSLQTPRANPSATPIVRPRAELEALTGLYLGMEYFLVTLDANDVLILSIPAVPALPPLALTPLSDGSFAAELLGRVWFNPMAEYGGETVFALSLGDLGLAPIAFQMEADYFLASEAFVASWTGTFVPENQDNHVSLATHWIFGVDAAGFANLQVMNLHGFHVTSPLAASAGADAWLVSLPLQNIERNADGVVTAFVMTGLRFVRA